jgi:hypothetical protein
VTLQTGSQRLGPDDATVEIRTYREGMASKAGHDLIIDLREWDATLALADDSEQSSLAFSADPRSLHVREGLRGLKPLSDKDRDEIRKNIDEKVLGGHPISLSVQGRFGKRGVRVDVVGGVGGGRGVRAVAGVGVVRAGARPYLGPRPGLAPGRRHDGCWGDPAGCVAAARSFRAVHAREGVAAGDCREPAAVHRCDEGLRAHQCS